MVKQHQAPLDDTVSTYQLPVDYQQRLGVSPCNLDPPPRVSPHPVAETREQARRLLAAGLLKVYMLGSFRSQSLFKIFVHFSRLKRSFPLFSYAYSISALFQRYRAGTI